MPLLSVNPNVAAAPFVTLGNVAATVLRRMPEPSAQTGPAGTLPLKRSCEPSEQVIGPVNVRLPANVTTLPPVTVRPPSCATPESVWMAPFHVVLPRALIVNVGLDDAAVRLDARRAGTVAVEVVRLQGAAVEDPHDTGAARTALEEIEVFVALKETVRADIDVNRAACGVVAPGVVAGGAQDAAADVHRDVSFRGMVAETQETLFTHV